MATKIGPKTVTQRDRSKALVFCVDAAHSDSYGGQPTSNVCTSRISDGAQALVVAGTNDPKGLTAASDSVATPFGNTAYKLTFSTGSFSTGYAAERATSYNWAVDAALTYSYYLWIAFNSDYAKTAFEGGNMYGYITGSAGMDRFDSSPTGAYIDAGGKRWYQYGKTGISIGASGSYNEFWAFFRNTASFNSEAILWVCGPQFELGSSFTPFTATSRTATTAITNISGVGAQGTDWVQGSAADTYGQGLTRRHFGINSRKESRKVMATLDPNQGHIGGAYWDFDGTDEYIISPTTITGPGGAGDMSLSTVATWINFDALGAYFFTIKETGTGYYQTYAYADGRIAHEFSRSNTGVSAKSTISATGTLATGAWNHIVVVTDNPGGACLIYHNGVVVTVGTAPDGYNDDFSTAQYVIGSNSALSSTVNGKIASCMIWGAALTAKEIKDIYIAQKGRFGK